MPRKPKAEKQREDIERIAWEIYSNRQRLGQPGDEHSDWAKAEKIFYNSIGKALFANHHPLIKLEKELLEPLLAWANDQAILSLLGLIGNLGLIIAVATYIGSEKQRRDAEVLNAWQTITSAYGQSGSGGRIQALEFLNASPGANWRRKFPWFCAPLSFCVWGKESLAGINLSVPDEDGEGVFLTGINLEGAFLSSANLEGADLNSANLTGAFLNSANLTGAFLYSANLTGAVLNSANLTGADLNSANLQGAELNSANLQGAFLNSANLTGAVLEFANLQGAELISANLTGAVLSFANLTGADLSFANLTGADLDSANLTGAVLYSANLQGAVNLTQDQLALAKLCRTILPEGITLDPNRDCEELGRDPATGEYIDP